MWFLRPSRDISLLQQRQKAVSYFMILRNTELVASLQDCLKHIKNVSVSMHDCITVMALVRSFSMHGKSCPIWGLQILSAQWIAWFQKISIPPASPTQKESYWKFQGGGTSQKPKFLTESMNQNCSEIHVEHCHFSLKVLTSVSHVIQKLFLTAFT